VVEARSSTNGGENKIDAKKSDAVCVVELERNHSLAVANRSND